MTSDSSSNIPTILGLSGNKLSTAQTLLVALPSFVLFGYNQAGLGGLLSLEPFGKHFPTIYTVDKTGGEKSHASTLQGLVVSAFSLGALTGALFCNLLGDKLGRKKMITIGACFAFIGQIIECSAFKISQLCVGRIIVGMGIGMLNITVPTWQSECSNPKNRGKHVALDGAFISLGYLLTNWICYGFYMGQKSKDVAWRVPIALGIVINVPLVCILFFPESPRWLVVHDRAEEARRIIAAFKGAEIDSNEVSSEISMIEKSYMLSLNQQSGIAGLFVMGEEKILMRFLMGMALQCLQQMSGGNLISVYSTVLYQENLGMSGSLSRVLSACTLTFKFLCGFIAFFTVDRFGRRPLIAFSGSGMALCMVCLAITTSQKENKSANVASVFFIFAFNFFIPIGFLGLNWLYVVEISPTRFRNQMAAFSSANNWLWNFVVLMITPVAISSISYRYYIIYAIIGAVIPVMVFFFFPETSGLSLEAIDIVFRKASSPFTVVSTAKLERKRILQGDQNENLKQEILEKAEVELLEEK